MPVSTKDKLNMEFSETFKFGTSTVAHQVEGKWDGDGSGTSVWDEYSTCHPNQISDRSTANETCGSYHKFEEDVFMLKSMNANSYNFTLSWARILPQGTTKHINKKGLDYYDDLINTLLENGIQPIVTLSDWDFPLPLLQKYAGGWMNKNLVYAFESYAKLCFTKFGDRVQQWITVAQPWTQSWNSYSTGLHPPNLSLGFKGAYLAFTNLLKAHALVYRLYEKRFKVIQRGKIGISLSCSFSEDTSISQQLGRVMYPLLHGKHLIYQTESTTEADSCCCSTLIQEGWKYAIKGSFDFVALEFTPQLNVKLSSCKISKEKSGQSSINMRSVLTTLKTDYRNPEVLVFCTGPPLVLPSQMMDIDRAQYFNDVAKDILTAIVEDQCNIKGYFPGKLMDCWEWESGFTISLGLFHVDFANSQKKRSPRASVVFILKHLFKERKIQPDLFE